jgi:hypothetical protein
MKNKEKIWRAEHYTMIEYSRNVNKYIVQKTNDRYIVHHNQINSVTDNDNIVCVISKNFKKCRFFINSVNNIVVQIDIKLIKDINDKIRWRDINIKKRTKHKNVRIIVVDETRVFLRTITTDDKTVCRKIDVFDDDFKKFFNAIRNWSFDCCRLTVVLSFHSAETEAETAEETERRKPTSVVLSWFPVLQMMKYIVNIVWIIII